MTISGNYAHPVYVNGYQCNNCTDVENAKKHIDPAHPKSGPFNVNAATDPTRRHDLIQGAQNHASVRFGGTLSGLNAAIADQGSDPGATNFQLPGQALDISA